MWWAWTQFTWALNSADTTHPAVEASVLAGTAVAFAMAVAIPTSLEDDGLWFAAAYIVVRTIGLGVYAAVAWEHHDKRAPLKRFIVLSIPGLVAVLIGGVVNPDAPTVGLGRSRRPRCPRSHSGRHRGGVGHPVGALW